MTRDEEPRRYDREEVALVLRHLAELQVHDVPAHALDRAELAQVAAEAGLDPRHLDGALARLDNTRKLDARRLGLRLWTVVSRQIPGELSAAKLEACALALDRHFGIIGEQRMSETSLSWFGRQVAVSISAREGMISVQIEERFHRTSQARLSMAAMSSIPALAMISLLSGPVLLVGLLVPVLAYGGVCALHNRRVEATQASLEQLADQLGRDLG